MSVLPDWVAEIVRCPSCHATLTERPASLVCDGCGLGYPIESGIPVLLVDQAAPAESD